MKVVNNYLPNRRYFHQSCTKIVYFCLKVVNIYVFSWLSQYNHCFPIILYHTLPDFLPLFMGLENLWSMSSSTLSTKRCAFLWLSKTLFTISLASLTRTFHCFGWIIVPKILVFTTWFSAVMNQERLFIPLFWWKCSAPIASSTVISFSPTWYSRCIMQGMAGIIRIMAASSPSSPLEIACTIIWGISSTIKNYLSLLCHSSKNP